MTDETGVVSATAEAFWDAWSRRRADRLMELWDRDDRLSSYLPAESEHRLIGAEAVERHVLATLERFETVCMRAQAVYPRRLKQDLATIFAVVDWALLETPAAAPMGGTIRVSGVMRRRGDTWRFSHYAESPLAPLVELRRFYQKVAADGHEALA